jgi:hypothetical protein
MNKKYENFFVFILIFLTIQYILSITELDQYSNMISGIQGHRANYFKNKNNYFSCKYSFILSLGYFGFAIILYYYVIMQKKSLIYGFITIVILSLMWDIAILSLFDFSSVYIITLMYDTFIVAGCGMLLAQYAYYNYYNVFKKILPLLFITYFLSMGWFFYESYRYNPDLSNIKGVALF